MRTVVTRRRRMIGPRLFGTVFSLPWLVSSAISAALFVHPYSVSAQEKAARPATAEGPRQAAHEGQKLPAEKAVESPARPSAGPSTVKEPVILLTGFEPFGRRRPPNASWQGIKDLDGRLWNGYRIVAREMPVVWGAPLECLPRWIDQYQPVAVFSFGMGGPGAFTLETVASNQRGLYPDNQGKKPPTPMIVAGAPVGFRASIDSECMARVLSEKGQVVKVSTEAGRYLCEENLYSLEFLKTKKNLAADVMFCHVPPLGSKLAGKPVTPDVVQQFVLDVLDSWLTVYHGGKAPTLAVQGARVGPAQALAVLTPVVHFPGVQAQPAKDEDPRLGEVRAFVERYFRTWSEQDMDGYDSCFLPEAVIQFIDDRGTITTTGKTRFVASQREVHRRSTERNIEVPETVDVRMEGRLAHAVVFWKLTSGARIQKGYDHFTLLKREGKWRIVNLVFYATAVEE
jgi:pyroglutamyl-peptidase